jgi:hypothetical protein
MLRDSGQGFNGRVLELHEDRLVIVAESRYDTRTIRFGEHVTVHGRTLPARRKGRIGIVVHRDGRRWRATRCDVVPGARMAKAVRGGDPCPAPSVQIARATVDGRTVRLELRLSGDVTSLRLEWGRGVERRPFVEPGVALLVVRHRFDTAGRRRVAVRAEGGFGPGCGTSRRLSATARRTVAVR